jgi:hypothetical protein
MEPALTVSSSEEPVQQTPRPEKGKLRARLGDTQIVELSDDEDDTDLVGRDDDDTAGDASDPDFLKEYPDNTDVSAIDLCIVQLFFLRFIAPAAITGSPSAAPEDHQ